MGSIFLSFKSVFPLLAFFLVGAAAKKLGFITKEGSACINKLVFRIFLPVNIILNIYSSDISEIFDLTLSVFVAATGIITFIIISAAVNSREKDRTVAPVMIQGIHKANYGLLAIPIATSYYGTNIGMAAALLMIVSPVMNTCSTIAFERARGGNTNIAVMIKKIILNPMVLSSIIGILLNVSGITIPSFIESSVLDKLSMMATPAAMISIGADFNIKSLPKWKSRLLIVIIGRLIVIPLILVPIAVALGIRNANLIAALLHCGGPTAVNSYSTAVAMGGNEELAGEIVAITSLLSIFTLFVFLSVLGSAGYL